MSGEDGPSTLSRSNFLNNRLIDKQNQFGEERDSILGSLLFIQDHYTSFVFHYNYVAQIQSLRIRLKALELTFASFLSY